MNIPLDRYTEMQGCVVFYISQMPRLLPEKRFALWCVLSQKTQPSQRSGEGRIYYLLQVRGTLGIFSKAVSPRRVQGLFD